MFTPTNYSIVTDRERSRWLLRKINAIYSMRWGGRLQTRRRSLSQSLAALPRLFLIQNSNPNRHFNQNAVKLATSILC